MNTILLATRTSPTPAILLDEPAIEQFLGALTGWQRKGDTITKDFTFPDHYQLMAFVNSVAWISHRSNHHPDVSYAYKICTLSYSTHDVGGLSENDFICAAKVDILLSL